MATGNELSVQYEQGELTQWRDPEQVLAEATKAAEALIRVIALKKKPVMFNGEQYLELEDWQTVGKFYGLSPRIVETRYVEFGGATGWEAVAEAVSQQGVVVSRAESMCLDDEANWGAVPVYEWQDELDKDGKKIWIDGPNGKKRPKANKVQTGTTPKPQFQLRSMAQTRACAKALRQVLSWVVVLGGFKPNVAEEMIEAQLGPEDTGKQAKAPVAQPTRASEKKAEGQAVSTAISGVIETSTVDKQNDLWVSVPNHLLLIRKDKATAQMVSGVHISVEARKLTHMKIGDYWLVDAVKEVKESIPDGEIVEDEDESQESPVDEAEVSQEEPPVPTEAKPVVESLKQLFDSGAVKTGAQVESTMSKKENAWKAHTGHDPAKHISVKQDALIYRIQTGRNLSDQVVKDLLQEEFGVGHRYHIPKDIFGEILDTLDPDFAYHERK